MRAHRLIPLFLVLACTPTEEVPVEADFELQIRPHVPEGMSLFDGSVSLKLVHLDEFGSPTVYDMGNGTPGVNSLAGWGPLDDGRIGVLLTSGGEGADEIDLGRTVGWGAGPLSGALGAGAESRDVHVTVAEVGGAGELTTTDEGTVWSAMAASDDDAVYIFGGSKAGGVLGNGTNQILKLESLHASSWSIENIGSLPDTKMRESEFVPGANDESYDQLKSRRVRMTATRVTLDGRTVFVLAGGRPQEAYTGNSLEDVMVFDPETDEVIVHKKSLSVGRAGHVAVALADDTVLIVGGQITRNADLYTADFDLYDPAGERTVATESLDVGYYGMAAASIGARGALVCGGTVEQFTGDGTMEPTAACNIISLGGAVSAAPPMPVARSNHAMVALADGKVLVTGGIADDISPPFGQGDLDNTAPSVANAYLYDPGTQQWRETSLMNSPRSMHSMHLMPDGRVVVIGGTQNGGPLFPQAGPAVDCPEVFDPVTQTFEVIGGCSSAAGGAEVVTSWAPNAGIVTLAGYTVANSSVLSDGALGLVGTPPDLPEGSYPPAVVPSGEE